MKKKIEIWPEESGKNLFNVWMVSGECLWSVWMVFGRCLEMSEANFLGGLTNYVIGPRFFRPKAFLVQIFFNEIF